MTDGGSVAPSSVGAGTTLHPRLSPTLVVVEAAAAQVVAVDVSVWWLVPAVRLRVDTQCLWSSVRPWPQWTCGAWVARRNEMRRQRVLRSERNSNCRSEWRQQGRSQEASV